MRLANRRESAPIKQKNKPAVREHVPIIRRCQGNRGLESINILLRVLCSILSVATEKHGRPGAIGSRCDSNRAQTWKQRVASRMGGPESFEAAQGVPFASNRTDPPFILGVPLPLHPSAAADSRRGWPLFAHSCAQGRLRMRSARFASYCSPNGLDSCRCNSPVAGDERQAQAEGGSCNDAVGHLGNQIAGH